MREYKNIQFVLAGGGIVLDWRMLVNTFIITTAFCGIAFGSGGQEALHSPDCTLELVHILYRHGDRNPIDPYETDPYRNESFWPGGYGQLTKIGKMQHYKVGQWLRERYSGFLDEVYSPYEILIQSSNVDRTVMSADANLAGLYPPKPSDNFSLWNPELNWQPIPVHSKPEIDNMLRMNAPCPRYDEIYYDFTNNSDVIKRINEENQDLYDLLTKYTGKNVTDPQKVDFIYDDLHIEKLYNFTLPEWTNEIFPKYEKSLRYLSEFSFKMMTYTPEMQRLKGGPLLKEMLKNIKDKISRKLDERRKMFVYSAHDTTVATLLNTLDVFDMHGPPYTAMVILELHKNVTSDEYFVQLLYRNQTDREPTILRIPGCESLCSYETFIDRTKSKVPEDWEKECQTSALIYNLMGIGIGALLVGLILALIIGFSMLLMSYLRSKRGGVRKSQAYPYLHLQMEDEESA